MATILIGMPPPSRRLILVTATILALATVSSATPGIPRGALHGWNVVLITLDATDAARIGAYGGSPATMPFFDSLAGRGVLVMHAYTITGSTSPAHATLLSGLLPDKHGVLHNGLSLARDAFWLPEKLHELGYVIVGSSVAFFMHRPNGLDRGFDHFETPATDDVLRPWESNRRGYLPFEERCLPLLSAGKPFFALIHLKGGHAPRTPVDEAFLRRHSATLPANRPPANYNAEQMAVGALDPAAWRADELAYYDASLSEADATLKTIFDDFRARGLAKKTLFVVTADHGETFDHGFSGEHWPSPYESTLHVPLLLYTENGALPAARIEDRLTTHADFVRTLGHLLGIPLESGAQSDSIDLFGATKRTSMHASSVSSLSYEAALRELFVTPESFLQRISHARVRRDLRSRLESPRRSALLLPLIVGASLVALLFTTIGFMLWRRPDRGRAVVSVALVVFAGLFFVSAIVYGIRAGSAAHAMAKKDVEDLERVGVLYWARIEMRPDGVYKLLHLGTATPRLFNRYPVRLYNVTADPAEEVDLLRNGSQQRVLAAGMLGRARSTDSLFGFALSDLATTEQSFRDAVARRLDRETRQKLKSLGYLQ
jgi:arylsulfatase A-like enzyme